MNGEKRSVKVAGNANTNILSEVVKLKQKIYMLMSLYRKCICSCHYASEIYCKKVIIFNQSQIYCLQMITLCKIDF